MAPEMPEAEYVSALSDLIAREFGIRFVVGLELECYHSVLRRGGEELVKCLGPILAGPTYGGVTVNPELGKGQLEINFQHRSDLRSLLCSVDLAKSVVLEQAAQRGVRVSFQARPNLSLPGSGLHVNMSFVSPSSAEPADAKKQNIAIQRVVVGLLCTMPHGMIFFAPSVDSYFRFRWQCDSADYRFGGAPRSVTWGGKNDRSAAIRLIRSPLDSTDWRIEHRVSGADANPNLVLAVLLAGAAFGLDLKLSVSEVQDVLESLAISGGGHEQLPRTLEQSLEVWESEINKANRESRFSPIFAAMTSTQEGLADAFWHRLAELVLRYSTQTDIFINKG